ncbi:SGNH/GDSL hydrolase family protein [Prevotella sp. 10(H)]|uniref:SGNH/GDSL hydrolase family protein n=1 Tax=Prevotella sp. 10(H) TaxID=1158294 RepID=UPI0004A786D5|nr:SGNH/GDSL hydrolase family protein [Prevotella sp. 10(H)]
MKKLFIIFSLFTSMVLHAQVGTYSDYLRPVKQELAKQFPENKTINIVFHGHSVPSGYFKTPAVNTLESYPHLTLLAVKKHYPYAVVNTLTTSIGGENAEQGALRFENEVLNHLPDVIFIDYALNDRGIGLERAKKAWISMIEKATTKGIKIVLMTPTPDLGEDIRDSNAPLELHSKQIRELAKKYKTGLIDSYKAFKNKKLNGEDLNSYMSQGNHPNGEGHKIVKELIMEYFIDR